MATPSSQSPLPDPWPFDQPPNCLAVTTKHVIREGLTITHVYHDADDHGWQFHFPGEKSMADAMLVSLATIVRHDPSVVDVADMPPGFVAIREKAGAPWRIERNPGETDEL